MRTDSPSTSNLRRRRASGRVALLLALCASATAFAFELNEAQRLVYERSHLASSSAGDVIDYRYEARVGDGAAIEDNARLHIDAVVDGGRRDVTLDFLSDARRLELPPFEGYRTNPVLIAMLEHVAQRLSATSGGGALYFRNRIRDAMAGEDARIEHGETTLPSGATVASTTLAFEPFRDDAYLGARPGYGEASFRIVLSEAVPGGVVAVRASSGEAPAVASFDYELRVGELRIGEPRIGTTPEGRDAGDNGDDTER